MADDSRSRRKPGTTRRARFFRRGGNIAEARLWNELKDRKLGGYKFIRQFPIGPYFADFACREERLVVEIDGRQHAERRKDRFREEFMRLRGFSTIRFWNTDVIAAMGPVCETILAALDGKLTEDVVTTDLRYVKADSTK